jgi:deazaflavin-dependent oxidoreductase (nitroreductase family)
MALTKSPPKGLLRWFLRAPLGLYRVGLGWLLGKRFLMFTHTGRISGELHETLVEVVYHDSETDFYYIASGWGERASWLLNIARTPEIHVITGRRKFNAVAARLTAEDGQVALWKYAQKYPAAFRALSKMMFGERLNVTLEDCGKMAQTIPIVKIQPKPK